MKMAGRWEKPAAPYLLLGAALLLLAGCAPAPLYTTAKTIPGAVTHGEIPRDAYGEPVWSAISPAGNARAPAS